MTDNHPTKSETLAAQSTKSAAFDSRNWRKPTPADIALADKLLAIREVLLDKARALYTGYAPKVNNHSKVAELLRRYEGETK